MGKRVILILAAVAIVVAALQWTPIRFLSKDATDFVWGFAGGLCIAAIVAWLVSSRKE
jgi:hypothetical protein